MKGCIEACEDKGKKLVIRYMNARVGYSEVEEVLGKFGVYGMNENVGVKNTILRSSTSITYIDKRSIWS